MKFFTKSWLLDGLIEAQWSSLLHAYSRHLLNLRLPPAIAALTKINTQGAYLLEVAHDIKHAALAIRLRCGNFQRGFCDVTLAFSQVIISQQDLDALNRAMRPAEIGVLFDELDRSGDAFEYRLLLYWLDEVAIQFHAVSIEQQPVPDQNTDMSPFVLNSVTCKLPPEVEFSAPTDYVKNCGGGCVVTISLERTPTGTITIQWNEDHFHFLANEKRVTYRRSGVRSVYIDRNAKMMQWPICRLDIELSDGGSLIFCTPKKYEHVFDELIQSLQAAPLPFTIHPERPKPNSLNT